MIASRPKYLNLCNALHQSGNWRRTGKDDFMFLCKRIKGTCLQQANDLLCCYIDQKLTKSDVYCLEGTSFCINADSLLRTSVLSGGIGGSGFSKCYGFYYVRQIK